MAIVHHYVGMRLSQRPSMSGRMTAEAPAGAGALRRPTRLARLGAIVVLASLAWAPVVAVVSSLR